MILITSRDLNYIFILIQPQWMTYFQVLDESICVSLASFSNLILRTPHPNKRKAWEKEKLQTKLLKISGLV